MKQKSSKHVKDLSPKLSIPPAWQELDDKGANENFINTAKLKTSIDKLTGRLTQVNKTQTPLKRGRSRLEFYQENGLAVYKSAEWNFKLQGKGWAVLVLLSQNKNTPYLIKDIKEKCNPDIAIMRHRFRETKDIEDTIRYIKDKLKVNKSEYFPILKRENHWIWEQK